MEWSDLKYAAAVGRHGSLKRAAQACGVNATTVSRRISALESSLGQTLFVRTRKKWRPTAAGVVLLERCVKIAEQVQALAHDLDRVGESVSGKVRLTAVDALITTWLVPNMAQLTRAHPGLQLEFFATNENIDPGTGWADVALRLAKPTRAGLMIKRLATMQLVVASSERLATLPQEERPVVLIGFLDFENPENRILRGFGGPVVCTATSFSVLISLVEAGVGVSLLPRSVARERGLVILEETDAYRELWRAIPEEFVDSPRIRAITSWLDDVFLTDDA